MQASAYVRFKPDTEERSTYLYRAYTKWCEDNLESPVPQKKFSQFLLKNAGKYGLTFSKHIEGKYRGFRGVCVHPPLLRHKTHESENSPPYAPQIISFDLLSPFSPGAYLPLPGGCGGQNALRGGRETRCAPKGRAFIPAMRPIKSNTGRYFCVVWGAWGA